MDSASQPACLGGGDLPQQPPYLGADLRLGRVLQLGQAAYGVGQASVRGSLTDIVLEQLGALPRGGIASDLPDIDDPRKG